MKKLKINRKDADMLLLATVLFIIANAVLLLTYGEKTFVENINELFFLMNEITTPFYIVFVPISLLLFAAVTNICLPTVMKIAERIVEKITV